MENLIYTNPYLSVALGALLTCLGTILIQKWLSRRSLVTFNVTHNRIGVSAEDNIYGKVQVTWNDHTLPNLYLSSIEITNRSSSDLEDISLKIYTNDAQLITERTQILGTTKVLDYTSSYKKSIGWGEGGTKTNNQMDSYQRQREYLVTVLNRGQTIRVEVLNSAHTDQTPSIWVDLQERGVRLKYETQQVYFLGVPQPSAAIIGSILGLILIIGLLFFIEDPILSACVSYLIGIFVLLPGAYAIKAYRKIKDLLDF